MESAHKGVPQPSQGCIASQPTHEANLHPNSKYSLSPVCMQTVLWAQANIQEKTNEHWENKRHKPQYTNPQPQYTRLKPLYTIPKPYIQLRSHIYIYIYTHTLHMDGKTHTHTCRTDFVFY